VLREVQVGETMEITVRGEVVAELGPPRGPRLTNAADARRVLARTALVHGLVLVTRASVRPICSAIGRSS
jgi:antitoxin (DNA-binding transcriptional repressor) of toxin-antitoxin stability system